jgi:hypothetical protein
LIAVITAPDYLFCGAYRHALIFFYRIRLYLNPCSV